MSLRSVPDKPGCRSPSVKDASVAGEMDYEMVQMILNEQGPFFVVEEPNLGSWEVDPKIRVDNKINGERWKKLIKTIWIVLPTVRQVRWLNLFAIYDHTDVW